MDYTEPITATAAQHIDNIKMIVKDFITSEPVDMLLENADIIQESKEAIETLRKYTPQTILTLEWWEGFNGYKIMEGNE